MGFHIHLLHFVQNTCKVQAALLCGFKLTKSCKVLGDPGKLQHGFCLLLFDEILNHVRFLKDQNMI